MTSTSRLPATPGRGIIGPSGAIRDRQGNQENKPKILYRFSTSTRTLEPLESTDASSAGVLEKDIEAALANQPTALFRTRQKDGDSPVLIVKTSAPVTRMPDVIALDAQGRVILVECKRWYADRDTLAQLIDYAAEYDEKPYERLARDWETGIGRDSGVSLLEEFRKFADDPSLTESAIGADQVLVVVAAGPGRNFDRISRYLFKRGLPVYFVGVQLYRHESGDLYLSAEPVDLDGDGDPSSEQGERVWFFNTDDTHSLGATKRILDGDVAAVWGYPDGPRILQKAEVGDTVFAYQNGVGVVARGQVVDGRVKPAKKEQSVFPECDDTNEWHLEVKWVPLPDGREELSSSKVRKATGAGLPIRNTFCRLWNDKVVAHLESAWRDD